MAERSVYVFIDDILGEIASIETHLHPLGFHRVAGSWLHRHALARSLEIICEASLHLPRELRERHPQIEWQRMKDFGNVLRHAYADVDLATVWEIVEQDLPALRSTMEREAPAYRRQEGFD